MREHRPTPDGLSWQLTTTTQHTASADGQPIQTTQIYEGTNQIQRMVIARKLFS
jgi:alkylation response protein AidB-like acyl-CoA dehydrogenase